MTTPSKPHSSLSTPVSSGRCSSGGRGGGAVVDPGVRAHHRPRLGLVHEPLERAPGRPRAASARRRAPGSWCAAVSESLATKCLTHMPTPRSCAERTTCTAIVAGEQRVLGVALEVPAADGRALQVDLRGEHHVDAVPAGLGGEHVHRPRRPGPRPTSRRARSGRGSEADVSSAESETPRTPAGPSDTCMARRPMCGIAVVDHRPAPTTRRDLLLEREAREQGAQRGSGGGPFSRGRLGGRVE